MTDHKSPSARERARRREYRHYQEARRRGITVVERFPLSEVFDRDGGRCGICGALVERERATLDHIVPVSRGGYHTRANVRVAHLKCNAERGSMNFGDPRFTRLSKWIPLNEGDWWYRDRELIEQLVADVASLRNRHGYAQPAYDPLRLFRNLPKLTDSTWLRWDHPLARRR